MLAYCNSKIKGTGKRYGFKSATFDVLSGYTCPQANECQAYVIRKRVKGKMVSRLIKEGLWTCYMAKLEATFKNAYKLHRTNWHKSEKPPFVCNMNLEIQKSKTGLIRVHSGGDFYNFTYFKKWYQIAKDNPQTIFFRYSKQATFVHWLIKNPLPNFKLIYSMGGLQDKYAMEHNLPYCKVIINDFNPDNLPIACTPDNKYNDFEYIMRGESFGIKLH